MRVLDWSRTADHVEIRTEEGLLEIFAIADSVIRCVYTKKDRIKEESALDIDRTFSGHVYGSGNVSRKGPSLEAEEMESGLELSAGGLLLWIDRKDGHFVWRRREDGRVLLEEGEKELTEMPLISYSTQGEAPLIRRVKTVDGERNFIENLRENEIGKTYRSKLHFHFQPGERIHGLGQAEEGIYDLRGHVQYLYQHNMRIPIPFFMSTRGYGILMDCGSLMTWNDDERGSWLFCDAVGQMDYYFVAGETADEQIDAFRRLTGRAAMLPKWAFGYIQSRERYENQEELVGVAERYRALGVGLDCVVQDWKTWEADGWGCKLLDKTRYPSMREASDRLHRLHVHSMVSVWPNMNTGTRDHKEMEEAGYLLLDLSTYNAFDEGARELYWKQCSRDLFQGGFDSWWCDSTEPFSGPDWSGEYMREPWERYRLVGEEHKRFLGAERANLYALAHSRGIFENQRKERSDKRVLNLTRSGYAGSQRFGTMLWSGDISARWDVLKKQIIEGLNMTMSGMPYWTLDIGGFFTLRRNWQKRGCDCHTDPSMKWFWQGDYEEGTADPAYRELYVRWFEMGAFLPMFRSHGTDTAREIWNFGEPGTDFYDALVRTIETRYRLMPYIYSLAARVVHHNESMMRALLFDYPGDPRAVSCRDAFLLGRSLLICPVTEAMYYEAGGRPLERSRRKSCYLPGETSGGRPAGWYDFYRGDYYEGGQEIEIEADLSHIPVFVKSGSILPMEEGLEYAEQRAETPLQFHLYPEKESGLCTGYYYEDAGDDYGYEEGSFNEIEMTYDRESGIFHIGAARHSFEGGICGRTCRIICGGLAVGEFIYGGREIRISCKGEKE